MQLNLDYFPRETEDLDEHMYRNEDGDVVLVVRGPQYQELGQPPTITVAVEAAVIPKPLEEAVENVPDILAQPEEPGVVEETPIVGLMGDPKGGGRPNV